MGTYDSQLYAMRMVIKEEQGDNHQQYVLQQMKKWSFGSYIISLIDFGINNIAFNYDDTSNRNTQKSKYNKPMQYAGTTAVFSSTVTFGADGSTTIQSNQNRVP